MRIRIYGRPNCSWCKAAKKFLDRKGYPYEYYDLFAMEPADAKVVIGFSGMTSVPIVQIDEIYIGGYNALEGYINGKESGV